MSLHSKSMFLFTVFIIGLSSPLVVNNAKSENITSIEVIHTAINPENNHTYHLLSEASWLDSAQVARGLDGFLVTVDSAEENQWIMETFGNFDDQSRHLWTGLSDQQNEGVYKWHDGTPFLYRNWGEQQPSSNGDEDYVHIAGTNMGNIMPGHWNDLENEPQYFPVYGVVEVGPGANYALRFDGLDDHVIIDEELPVIDSFIEIEAWINIPDSTGIQFITMFGDYGWGLYLNDGKLSYSSEYALAKHPSSNLSIVEGIWTNVKVIVENGTYGEFFIDGDSAGLIQPVDANIPSGNFGSNDCYQSGAECDELYLGKMGAGCDCNFLKGMLDNVTISNGEVEIIWTFPEGESSTTKDNSGNLLGEIFGPAWVMPDGTIVTQATQLFSDQEINEISGEKGDQLLFFIEIEPLTRNLLFEGFFEYDNKEDWREFRFDIYFGLNEIPNPWRYDDHAEDIDEYIWKNWVWPDEGTLWIIIIPTTDINNLAIKATSEIADPPPSVNEMTQLFNGIPVTGQYIEGGREIPQEERILYYYVEVLENLSSLSIRTYDGTGNVDLAISSQTVPDPFEMFFGFLFDNIDNVIQNNNYDSANGPGNEHQVTLYDVTPGIYYITTFSYGRAQDFTIAASMTFEPKNIDPQDAVELSPGVAYGPVSGYNELRQYFKIDVPNGTERLEVDLFDGFGEASLYMKHELAPTTTDYTHQSNSPGAGDKIGFNDPTPGMWFILLATDMVFGEVMIKASFENRYVWDYDGTPIELFNGEEISGIQAPEGEILNFFTILEKPGDYLEVTTYGGTGTLVISGVGEIIEFQNDLIVVPPKDDMKNEDKGRQSSETNFESTQISAESNGFETEQTLYIEFPANGRFDITISATESFADVTIVANWAYSAVIDSIEEKGEKSITKNCRDVANTEMNSKDLDKDGLLSKDEAETIMLNGRILDFKLTDLNNDGELEFAEVLQQACSCGNEMELYFNQLSTNNQEISIEMMSSQVYQNSYDFFEVDSDSNLRISRAEVEILVLLCETSFDAFDGDGDGVPDDLDEFPEDPTESKDTDGDGVGDNADLAPSIANDLIYSAGAILLIGLLAMLVIIARGKRGKQNIIDWESEKHFGHNEEVMDMELQPYNNATDDVKNFPLSSDNEDNGLPLEIDKPSRLNTKNLFEDLVATSELSTLDYPPDQLFGMIDSNGVEVVEYPAKSGTFWQRQRPGEPWVRK